MILLRNNRYSTQHGVVLIAMLTILVAIFTSLMISNLSLDKLKANRVQENEKTLNLAKEALLGFGLLQTPPGTLPCPDTTGDGLENTMVVGCQSQRGLFPYRTLNLGEISDRSGARLWYALELAYAANALGERNPSRVTTLTLDGNLVAAVLIAPGSAIEEQNRVLLNVTDFLEGDNADANLDTYVRPQSDIENDQIIGLSLETYWPLMARPALNAARQLLVSYQAVCNEYPFAAVFGGPYNSVNNLQIGSLPLSSALPIEWGLACASGTAPTPPSWLINHWQEELYYSLCTSGEGSCIQTVGGSINTGSAIVIAPGIILGAQSRPSGVTGNYFELENISLPNTQFRDLKTINHSASYNDTTNIITP